MSIEPENFTEEYQIAGEIFDRYAEETRRGEVAKDIGNRAVAAAALLSYATGGQKWPDVLDGALRERGVVSYYADLSPDKLRARSRRASDETSKLTKKSRTLLEELKALNTFDGTTD
jgi:hypothetical protein